MSNQFDTHQFADRHMHPVRADYVGNGEFTSNGIAFEDYARMTTQRHKLAAGRQGPAPDWVFNDTKLRAVIVGCVESRAFISRSQRRTLTGTDAERLARAQQKIAKDKPGLESRIGELCRQYVVAKNAGDVALTKHFQQKVEETDTQLRMMENPARFYVGCAYHYWRSGLDSVATANELGLKPPHVRCLLWRMAKVAGELGFGPPKNNRRNRAGRSPSSGQLRKREPPTDVLLAVAKAVAEKERRRKLAVAMTGRELTQAHKDKIGAASKGRTHSEETRQKLSKLKQGHEVSAATRQKMSDTVRAQNRSGVTHLIPLNERLPLVVRMYAEAATTGAIAKALGWGKRKDGVQDGYGMVKKLAIQAGLR